MVTWGTSPESAAPIMGDGSPRSQFVLNRAEYRDARILVADRDFGCGSSREHAVWALYDYGIKR